MYYRKNPVGRAGLGDLKVASGSASALLQDFLTKQPPADRTDNIFFFFFFFFWHLSHREPRRHSFGLRLENTRKNLAVCPSSHARTMASLTRNFLRPASRRILASQLRVLPMASRYYSDQPAQGAAELGVGELQGAKFKIEPLRRVGEDDKTKRARLICTSSTRLKPTHVAGFTYS